MVGGVLGFLDVDGDFLGGWIFMVGGIFVELFGCFFQYNSLPKFFVSTAPVMLPSIHNCGSARVCFSTCIRRCVVPQIDNEALRTSFLSLTY